MRVLFINPPREGFFINTERQVPIGIFYLAKACLDAGFEVEVFDTLVAHDEAEVIPYETLSPQQKERLRTNPIFNDYIRYGYCDEDVLRRINELKPFAVCISIMFSCFHDSAERLAIRIKEQYPNIIIIAGGTHVTTNYIDVLKTHAIDYCLRFEGENTLPQLLCALVEHGDLGTINGIAFQNDGIVVNGNHQWIEHLDPVHPAYSLINAELYDHTVTIITSRGCPYSCEFCTVHQSMGKRFRFRTAQNVVDEIEYYVNHGFTKINIEDDNFTFDIERTKNICKEIVQKGIICDIYLLNGVSVEKLDEDCISLLADAGVKKVFFGLETTSDSLLTSLKKTHTSLVKTEAAVRISEKYGIEAGASIIMGFPEQSLNSILDDIATLISRNIPMYAINALYPLPGTGIYKDCVKRGILTGAEDYIFLGGDNFIIHNESFERKDLYYLWVAVKSITKWGYRQGSYLTFKSMELETSLELVSAVIGSKHSENSLTVSKAVIHAEMISAHDKVFTDMLATFIFLMTGKWLKYSVKQQDEMIEVCFNSECDDLPRALKQLIQRF